MAVIDASMPVVDANPNANGTNSNRLSSIPVRDHAASPSPSPGQRSPSEGFPDLQIAEDVGDRDAVLQSPGPLLISPAMIDTHRLPSPAPSVLSSSSADFEREGYSPRPSSPAVSPLHSDGPGLKHASEPPRPRKLSLSKSPVDSKQLKLSPSEIQELTSTPGSLPVATAGKPEARREGSQDKHEGRQDTRQEARLDIRQDIRQDVRQDHDTPRPYRGRASSSQDLASLRRSSHGHPRPPNSARTTSTPSDLNHRLSWPRLQTHSPTRKRGDSSPKRETAEPKVSVPKQRGKATSAPEPPTPVLPAQIPLPPMAIPTYLQLELSTSKPSPLFIYRTPADDFPFESSRLKFERLLNFLLLPPQLEQVLFFGTMACLDAWIHTFTILPLRFIQAIYVLVQWWAHVVAREARYISGFVYYGVARVYERQRGRRRSIDSASTSRSTSVASRPSISTTASFRRPDNVTSEAVQAAIDRKLGHRKHRRSRSQPSALSSSHKSDLLQGLVVVCTSAILMKLDASRMYHSIRGQTDIKLYVIYNVLEVGDKLLSALGQDIFECLNSNETLDRKPDGRSKVLRPFGMFLLALFYNVIHSAALFYQVVTLNVAVNAYSNALLTLLLSNQFVEIKSTVFKKFEKENLFQLTCADVVERLQLWIMLTIIALRNIVEVGGFSLNSTAEVVKNSRTFSFLPNSFTILPHWAGEVFSPFLIVLGSEMAVDWLKHAYIIKFNNVKPALYQKFLDVLAKDYYTNAFVNQNLMKRVGLPVLPLACLFIRAMVQTYHMFIATQLPPPIPSKATDLSVDSPATTAALERFDDIIRRALGRSAFGIGRETPSGAWRFLPDADDFIAVLTMLVFFLGAFMVLLAFKLVLGMCLLRFARNRYSTMQERENLSLDTQGKRIGGFGIVEMDDEKRKIIYEDDPDGAKVAKDRERRAKEKAEKGGVDFGKVQRYEMAAKRIW